MSDSCSLLEIKANSFVTTPIELPIDVSLGTDTLEFTLDDLVDLNPSTSDCPVQCSLI